MSLLNKQYQYLEEQLLSSQFAVCIYIIHKFINIGRWRLVCESEVFYLTRKYYSGPSRSVFQEEPDVDVIRTTIIFQDRNMAIFRETSVTAAYAIAVFQNRCSIWRGLVIIRRLFFGIKVKAACSNY